MTDRAFVAFARPRRTAGLVYGDAKIVARASSRDVAIRALQENLRKADANALADGRKLRDALALAAEAVDRVPRKRRGDLEGRLDQLLGESPDGDIE